LLQYLEILNGPAIKILTTKTS